jgi:hypothetical protein
LTSLWNGQERREIEVETEKNVLREYQRIIGDAKDQVRSRHQ